MTAPTRVLPRAVLVDSDMWPRLEAWCRGTNATLTEVPSGPGQAPRWTMSRRARRNGNGLAARDGLLTARESQVLLGMSEGLSNGEIGRELYLSEDTIKCHARKIFRKLGARDRAHAVALAYRSGLLGGAS